MILRKLNQGEKQDKLIVNQKINFKSTFLKVSIQFLSNRGSSVRPDGRKASRIKFKPTYWRIIADC
jgi:hypothetical protein